MCEQVWRCAVVVGALQVLLQRLQTTRRSGDETLARTHAPLQAHLAQSYRNGYISAASTAALLRAVPPDVRGPPWRTTPLCSTYWCGKTSNGPRALSSRRHATVSSQQPTHARRVAAANSIGVTSYVRCCVAS
jgi:hypothetical protein